jgi:hypothetical protein
MIPGHNNLGSPAIDKELLFAPTGNGVDVDHPGATMVRAPDAPSLVCFNKLTGKVVWKDNSPGKDIYGGNHASPLVVSGKVQVIQPQADGWVRSFDSLTGKLIWKFDTNYKGAKWDWTERDGKSKHVGPVTFTASMRRRASTTGLMTRTNVRGLQRLRNRHDDDKPVLREPTTDYLKILQFGRASFSSFTPSSAT